MGLAKSSMQDGSRNKWPRIHDQTDTYEALRLQERVSRVDTVNRPGPQDPGTCRIVFISDTHTLQDRIVNEIPNGDVLIHSGDFSQTGSEVEVVAFLDWMSSLPHPEKIFIAGNHEPTFDSEHYDRLWHKYHGEKQNTERIKELVRDSGLTYLENSSTTIAGGRFKVWGSPYTVSRYFKMGFQKATSSELSTVWDMIPNDTDILVTHGPPLGIGDYTRMGDRVGCVELLRAVVQRVHPLIHAFGHIHEGYGNYACEGCQTTFVNAATCNVRYRPNQPAIVLDVPIE